MRRISIIIMLLAPVMGWSGAAAAEPDPPAIRLRSEIEPREIRIGDRVRYEITTRFPAGVKPVPIDPDTDFGPFELVSYDPGSVRRRSETENEQRHTLVLTTFSTGTVSISSFSLTFEAPGEQRVEAPLSAVDVNVISLLEKHGDEGGLRPVKGLFAFRSYLWLWILLGVIAAGVLAWAALRFIRRRRGGGAAAGEPARPPEEVLWDLLHELETSDLVQEGRVKEFYSRLSAGLRQYIEGRYGFPALDRTTSEILGELRKRNLDPGIRSDLKRVLDQSDLVKFARVTPPEEDVDADIDLVKRVATETTPKPAPEAAGKEETVPL